MFRSLHLIQGVLGVKRMLALASPCEGSHMQSEYTRVNRLLNSLGENVRQESFSEVIHPTVEFRKYLVVRSELFSRLIVRGQVDQLFVTEEVSVH